MGEGCCHFPCCSRMLKNKLILVFVPYMYVCMCNRAIFRGGRGGGATALPDVFDLLQTNLQNYWAYKLGWMSRVT